MRESITSIEPGTRRQYEERLLAQIRRARGSQLLEPMEPLTRQADRVLALDDLNPVEQSRAPPRPPEGRIIAARSEEQHLLARGKAGREPIVDALAEQIATDCRRRRESGKKLDEPVLRRTRHPGRTDSRGTHRPQRRIRRAVGDVEPRNGAAFQHPRPVGRREAVEVERSAGVTQDSPTARDGAGGANYRVVHHQGRHGGAGNGIEPDHALGLAAVVET
jgi:hypothetical protein